MASCDATSAPPTKVGSKRRRGDGGGSWDGAAAADDASLDVLRATSWRDAERDAAAGATAGSHEGPRAGSAGSADTVEFTTAASTGGSEANDALSLAVINELDDLRAYRRDKRGRRGAVVVGQAAYTGALATVLLGRAGLTEEEETAGGSRAVPAATVRADASAPDGHREVEATCGSSPAPAAAPAAPAPTAPTWSGVLAPASLVVGVNKVAPPRPPPPPPPRRVDGSPVRPPPPPPPPQPARATERHADAAPEGEGEGEGDGAVAARPQGADTGHAK
jgi:hypothetical protein